ncbi:MAG: hypothetical protein KKA84_11845 [Bacteroidetes bacterium]|nr:hypothetical protein [Bacteroidota bacterium]
MIKAAFLFFILTTNLLAQIDSNSVSNISSFLEDLDLEEESNEMNEYIEFFVNNPLDLNSTSRSDLESLPLVDNQLANSIYTFIQQRGFLYSTKELYLIDNIDLTLLRRILPFFTVNPIKTSEKSSVILFENWDLRMRDRWSRTFYPENRTNTYLGNIDKHYNRVLLSNKDIFQSGIITEKDPGENKFDDLLSYHFSLKAGNLFDHLVLGDYNIEFGQGLVLWTPYSFSKGTETVRTVKKKPRSIVTKTSTEEVNFFRGCAIKKTLGAIELSGFYSVRDKDASLNENGDVTSLLTTGYHRTQNELLKTGNTKETTLGFTMGFAAKNIAVYLLSLQSYFSRNIVSDKPYSINGDRFQYYSASYEIQLNKFQLSGEFAYNNISVASINNMYIPIIKNVKAIISFRNYPRNFSNLYGRGFGEQNGNMNETGIYFGTSISTSFGNINFYLDKFAFPWASYHSPFPSNGSEYLINFSSRKFNNIEIRLKAKYEVKEKVSEPRMNLFSSRKLDLKTELKYYPENGIRLKSGFAYTEGLFEDSDSIERGYLFYQDVYFTWRSYLQFYLRFLTYKTNSYNSRIYQFENGHLGTMTNLPFYDEGYKWYIFVKYSLANICSLGIKYSLHYQSNSINTDNSDFIVFGDTENALSIQIEFHF